MRRVPVATCLFTASILSLTCTSDRPLEPTTPANRASFIDCTPSLHTVTSTAEFEAAWAGGNFCSGDIFYVPSGVVLLWNTAITSTCLGSPKPRFCATNKSFTIRGADTTAALVMTAPGGNTKLFDVMGSGTESITIESIKFVRTGGGGFVDANNFASIVVTDVVMDLESNFVAGCSSLVVTRLDLETTVGGGFTHRSNAGVSYSHVIRDSRFRMTNSSPGPVISSLPSASGTVTWENNVFSAQGGAGLRWYNLTVTNGTANLNLINNDFKYRNVRLAAASNDGFVGIDLECNNSNLVFCPDSLIDCLGCDGDFSYDLAPTSSWRFNYGTCFSFLDLGSISQQNACVVNDTAYVEFSVACPTALEPYVDVSAVFSDDDCVTGPTQVQAWKNASTGKWNTKFPVSAFTDSDFYWRGQATLCIATESGTAVTGPCTQKTTRPCGGGGLPPTWFTQN